MSKAIAFFDLDGTVISGSSEKALYRKIAAQQGHWFRWRTACYWLVRAVFGLLRGESLYDALRNRYYLRGVAWLEIQQLAETLVSEQLVATISPTARKRMEWHRRQGDKIVLISATLQPIVEAMAKVLPVDSVLACKLPLDQQGRVKGTESGGSIPRRRGKMPFVRQYAESQSVDLKDCWGYGNTAADGFFMQLCGAAMAVNPDQGLQKLAQHHSWPVVDWHTTTSDD